MNHSLDLRPPTEEERVIARLEVDAAGLSGKQKKKIALRKLKKMGVSEEELELRFGYRRHKKSKLLAALVTALFLPFAIGIQSIGKLMDVVAVFSTYIVYIGVPAYAGSLYIFGVCETWSSLWDSIFPMPILLFLLPPAAFLLSKCCDSVSDFTFSFIAKFQ